MSAIEVRFVGIDHEREEAWVEEHRINGVRARIEAQVNRAAKRGSKATPVNLGDLIELLERVKQG